MSIYWDESAMKADNIYSPTILAIGDSWFWYPFPGGSLASYLGPIVDSKEHVILAKGMNGAEAFDYVEGKYKNTVKSSLKFFGGSLSAVFISGGGNDFAGLNDLRPLLNLDCSAANSAAECFLSGGGGFTKFLERLEDHYRTLIGRVYTYTSLDCKIIMHNYDYAIPDGRSVFGDRGWLRPALVSAKVPPHLYQECIRYLIDEFHKMLTRISEGDPKHLLVVDSRDTLLASDWANELHPTGNGFKKIAHECWEPVLKDAELG